MLNSFFFYFCPFLFIPPSFQFSSIISLFPLYLPLSVALSFPLVLSFLQVFKIFVFFSFFTINQLINQSKNKFEKLLGQNEIFNLLLKTETIKNVLVLKISTLIHKNSKRRRCYRFWQCSTCITIFFLLSLKYTLNNIIQKKIFIEKL